MPLEGSSDGKERFPHPGKSPHFTAAAAAAAKSLQLCPTLCDPIDCSPPGSSVPGILQARILEWVAISFSITSLAGRLAGTEKKLQRRAQQLVSGRTQGDLYTKSVQLP